MKKPEPPDWAWKIANGDVDFRGEHLPNEIFSRLDLHQKDFRRAFLRGVKFDGCDLTGANFADADLSGANFRGAQCQDVDFSNANLSKANFYKANLQGSAFLGCNLFSTVFRESKMAQTVFANLDLETCVGLDSVEHTGHSSIAMECLYRSGNMKASVSMAEVPLKQIAYDALLLYFDRADGNLMTRRAVILNAFKDITKQTKIPTANNPVEDSSSNTGNLCW